MADPQKLNPVDKTVIGTTGLPIWIGRVQDDFLVELSGDRGVLVLREMSEQDPIIGAVLLAVELLVRRTPFPVIPADMGKDASDADLQKAQDQADFVEECLKDMYPDWGTTISEILTMIQYGWSYFEILYKIRQGRVDDPLTGNRSSLYSSMYDDNKVGWAGWSIRAQETRWRWDFVNETGEVRGLWQMAPPIYQVLYIPKSKALHFRIRARKGNPEGTSLLRHAYRPWYYKKNIEKIEGIGIERDLAGLPVAYCPPEYMDPDAPANYRAIFDSLKQLVTQIRNDEQAGIVFPLEYDEQGKPKFELKLLATGGQRSFDTDKIIQRYDQRIAMSFLADFMLLGHEAVGSYALADTKTDLFARAVGAVLDTIVHEINTSGVPQLMALNGTDAKYTPHVGHGDLSAPDLKDLGTYLQDLALAGMEMFPNKPLEDYLLEAAGLPVPDPLDEEDEEYYPDVDEGLLTAIVAEIQAQQAGGAQPPTPGTPPGSPQGQPPTQPRTVPTGGAADQNQRTGRTTQSAAARQIRQPGAVRRAAGTGPQPQAAAEQFGDSGMAASQVVYDDRPYKRPKRNASAIVRDLRDQGHTRQAIAKYLGVRVQQVHAADKRRKKTSGYGAKMLGPNTIQDIQNALSSSGQPPASGDGGDGGGEG